MISSERSNPYENLACSIIQQAIADYISLLNGVPIGKEVWCDFSEVENFFRSEWFVELNPTSYTGDQIIIELIRGVCDGGRKTL